MNVDAISKALKSPQSTVATNIQILETPTSSARRRSRAHGGAFGDKRGIHTPRGWKLEGSRLTTWNICDRGCFVDGVEASAVNLN